MPLWHRLIVFGAVLLLTVAAARVIDRLIARRPLAPGTATRYRVLRRTVTTAILLVGLLSALLVIPQVRTVAGGILASSAVLGLIIGFAAQRTLGNVVAGLLIALTQPIRLGDSVELQGDSGTVEEIGLSYTLIRTGNGSRLVIPNEKLASDTIRNSTIVTREAVAQITVQVPLDADLRQVAELLRDAAADEREPEVEVTSLDDKATLVLRVGAVDAAAAGRLESDLRLRAHERLRQAGVLA